MTVTTERMVSMGDQQLICLRMTLKSQREQVVTVEAALDEHVANLPVHDDQMVEETETFRLLETVNHALRVLGSVADNSADGFIGLFAASIDVLIVFSES